MGRQPPIETTSTSDVMITYWNHFDRVSASELNESYQNKILIWGMTPRGDLIIQFLLHMVSCILMKYNANLLQTVLSGDRIQNNFLLDFVEIILVIGLGLLVLFMVYQLPTYTYLVLHHCNWFFSWNIILDMDRILILFDALYASLTGLLVFGHASFNKYFVTYKLKEQIKGQFKKVLITRDGR